MSQTPDLIVKDLHVAVEGKDVPVIRISYKRRK